MIDTYETYGFYTGCSKSKVTIRNYCDTYNFSMLSVCINHKFHKFQYKFLNFKTKSFICFIRMKLMNFTDLNDFMISLMSCECIKSEYKLDFVSNDVVEREIPFKSLDYHS